MKIFTASGTPPRRRSFPAAAVVFATVVALSVGTLGMGARTAQAAPADPANPTDSAVQGTAAQSTPAQSSSVKFDPSTMASITIKNAQAGHIFTVYKLGTYIAASTDGTNLTGLAVESASEHAEAAVRSALGTVPADQQDAVAYLAGSSVSKSAQLRAASDNLPAAITSNDVAQVGNAVTTSISGKDVALTNLTEGWYFIRDQYVPSGKQAATVGAAKGDLVDGVGIIVGTTVTDTATQKTYNTLVAKDKNGAVSTTTLGEADAKSDDPGLKGNPGGAAKTAEGSLMPGNRVEFELSATVPDYIVNGNDSYTYQIIDTPASGFVTSSAKLMKVAFADSTSTADAATQTDVTSRLGAADGFTFAVDSPKAGQITIDLSPLFTSEIVKKSNAFVGKKLKINYSLQVAPATDSAHAAADAVDLTKLSNSFVINDQGHTVPGGFFDPPSITVDGTTGFRKVDENGNPLNGAVFTLATYSGIVSGTAISGDANGDGTVSETEASDPVTAGTVTFHHVVLAMSKPYAITETAQPQGYMAMDAVVELTFKRPGLSAPSVSVTLSGPTTGLEDPTDGSEASGDMSEALRSSLSSSGEEGVTGGNTGDATAPVTSASPSAFVFAYGEKQGTDSLDMVTVADDFQSVTVRNVRSLTQLPLTGAFGTVVFSIVGALLAGGAFAMALIAKRNHVASRVA